MGEIAVRGVGLGKRYRLGAQRKPYRTLTDTLTVALASPFRQAGRVLRGRPRGHRRTAETIWALRDVAFEVPRGEVLGIVGRNGAGKTTLLKILSRITEPTEGYAEVHGRVGSLLEVGTGFHPELTGRENIYLNGAILGMRKVEIARKFDEIVAFAEVERFIDTPVKHYSSGMYVRLAFAVAAHLEPEILVVDEVLAVGDARFQRKCMRKMGKVAGEGRTVLFVSHNLAAVRQLCTRGLLLSQGRVQAAGPIGEVVDMYMIAETEVADEVVFPERADSAAQLTRMCLRNADGKRASRFSNAEPILLEAEYVVRRTLSYDHLFLLLYRADGVLVLKAADDDGHRPSEVVRTPGRYVSQIRFPGGILNEGVYRYRVVLGKRRGVEHDNQTGSHFEIEDTTDYTSSCFGKRNGLLLFPLDWSERKTESW